MFKVEDNLMIPLLSTRGLNFETNKLNQMKRNYQVQAIKVVDWFSVIRISNNLILFVKALRWQ